LQIFPVLLLSTLNTPTNNNLPLLYSNWFYKKKPNKLPPHWSAITQGDPFEEIFFKNKVADEHYMHLLESFSDEH